MRVLTLDSEVLTGVSVWQSGKGREGDYWEINDARDVRTARK